MVLQRGQEISIWGTATPGEKVSAIFRQTTVTATTGDDGKWNLRLPEQSVGDPTTLKIQSGDDAITFEDVLIGEVWICSGQSNMEWRVDRSANPEEEIAAADYPSIRLLDVPRTFSIRPQEDVDVTWQVCSPETVGAFSAAGYYFGRKLWNELDVPIGLVSIAWGGSAAEAWTPLPTLQQIPAYREIAQEYSRTKKQIMEQPDLENKLQAIYDTYYEEMNALAEAIPAPDAEWFDPEATFENWHSIQPGEAFLAETNGLVHVRRLVTLTPEQAQRKSARLHLGQIDNFDATWVNGVAVGKTGPDVQNARTTLREYAIPDGTLKPGKNVVLIQIMDIRRIAYFGREIDQPKIAWPQAEPALLKEDWMGKTIIDLGPRPQTLPHRARKTGALLWNGMVAPFVPATIRGIIWYQGESNASRPEQYRTLFPDMIQAWRTAWGGDDFPFYFVQLANIEDRDGWPELREAQRETLALPNTGMAVTIDIGDPNDVHPKNKQDVGKRLALWALANTYGVTEPSGWLGTLPGIGRFFQEPLPHSGPLFREAIVEEGQVRLRFDHVYGGLKTSDGEKLKGFTIAEENGSFRPAEARIENNEVIVSHPEIKTPRDVRYAWEVNPIANLTNDTGLPASPFRTDRRPLTLED